MGAKITNLYSEQVLQTGVALVSSLPAELIDLCGEEKIAPFVTRDGTISIGKITEIVESKYDCFLTHEWGENPFYVTHIKVAKINDVLKSMGITTWFDADRLSGDIRQKMTEGIDDSKIVLAFVTKRYVEKVGGPDSMDNCKLEFNYAGTRKRAEGILPVVLDPAMRNQVSWSGPVGFILGTSLYVDNCAVSSDPNETISPHLMRELYDRIIEKIGLPVKTKIERLDLSKVEVLVNSVNVPQLGQRSSIAQPTVFHSVTSPSEASNSPSSTSSATKALDANAKLIDEMNTWFIEKAKIPYKTADLYSKALMDEGIGNISRLASRVSRNCNFIKEKFGEKIDEDDITVITEVLQGLNMKNEVSLPKASPDTTSVIAPPSPSARSGGSASAASSKPSTLWTGPFFFDEATEHFKNQLVPALLRHVDSYPSCSHNPKYKPSPELIASTQVADRAWFSSLAAGGCGAADKASFLDAWGRCKGSTNKALLKCYAESPAFLGFGVNMSAPYLHFLAMVVLQDKFKGQNLRMMDVGCGTGYTSLQLALACKYLGGSVDMVFGIDHVKEFVDIGKSVFDAIKTPASEPLLKRIELHAIDARALTYESSSTFDVIHAGAAIPLPQVEAYKRMLKVDGILVGPVQESEEKQAFVKYTKRADGSIQREELLGVIYAKLQDLDAQLRPQGR